MHPFPSLISVFSISVCLAKGLQALHIILKGHFLASLITFYNILYLKPILEEVSKAFLYKGISREFFLWEGLGIEDSDSLTRCGWHHMAVDRTFVCPLSSALSSWSHTWDPTSIASWVLGLQVWRHFNLSLLFWPLTWGPTWWFCHFYSQQPGPVFHLHGLSFCPFSTSQKGLNYMFNVFHPCRIDWYHIHTLTAFPCPGKLTLLQGYLIFF